SEEGVRRRIAWRFLLAGSVPHDISARRGGSEFRSGESARAACRACRIRRAARSVLACGSASRTGFDVRGNGRTVRFLDIGGDGASPGGRNTYRGAKVV